MPSRVLVELKKKKPTQTDFITTAPRGPACLRLRLVWRVFVCLFHSVHSEGLDTEGGLVLTHWLGFWKKYRSVCVDFFKQQSRSFIIARFCFFFLSILWQPKLKKKKKIFLAFLHWLFCTSGYATKETLVYLYTSLK